MPAADKRQRKKEHARMAREARQAAERRQKRFRTARNFGIVAAVFILGIVLINVFTGGGGKKASSTSTTVSTPTSTPTALPAGCVKTVPKASTVKSLPKPAMTIDPNKTYTANISTTCGEFAIALDAKNAPKSVNNFVYLARKGFYDGLKWHRVAAAPPVIQGGDPQGTGNGGPGYTETVELPKDGKYPKGTVAWAKTGNDPKGSAGSQFFVDTGDASSIGADYGYIGKVSAGQANVDKMGTQATASGTPANPLYIFKVTINES